MFGFEITSDLLILTIFAQTITIALIILITNFKIKKFHHKIINLNEKIEDKIDSLDSKLSDLSNQILAISTNQDKFNSSVTSMDPSAYYRFKETANYESDSLNLLTDPTFEIQNRTDSELIDAKLTPSKLGDPENKSTAIPETTSGSPSTLASTSTSESAHSIAAKSSVPPYQHSTTEISASNHPDYSTAQDKTINFGNNDNEPSNNGLTDIDRPIEKNTNPEIDKIEQEILTALKRLGGDDEGGVGGVGGNDTDTTA
ncbi:hypothetical protein NARC_160087 [Candidatus Nitrosocosmicus arcticus]|uniref:Uncharacterized protein n=2 Tax=Candidatus Nitrosocosmicus arcticus TaxID=2035267 RepID=A0A557SRY8_9ARCH|nr:hypothetical protein NARC_160087 [Candidatus Nitrosocosmicus arcticus]